MAGQGVLGHGMWACCVLLLVCLFHVQAGMTKTSLNAESKSRPIISSDVEFKAVEFQVL